MGNSLDVTFGFDASFDEASELAALASQLVEMVPPEKQLEAHEKHQRIEQLLISLLAEKGV